MINSVLVLTYQFKVGYVNNETVLYCLFFRLKFNLISVDFIFKQYLITFIFAVEQTSVEISLRCVVAEARGHHEVAFIATKLHALRHAEIGISID